MQPVNEDATEHTVSLLVNLSRIAPDHILYGQHNPYSRGLHVDGTAEHSDCKHITGSHPAVAEFDLVSEKEWAPQTPTQGYHVQIPAHSRTGGVISISWHMRNPTGGGVKQTGGRPVQEILTPDSPIRRKFTEGLDAAARFLSGLVDEDGNRIPVIFRPFHENTHSGFWWGLAHCSPDEFRRLWRYVYGHLTDTRSVDNLLWAYSPAKPRSIEDYLERYPGDDCVDLLGFDWYGHVDTEPEWPAQVLNACRVVSALADERGKVAAYTESGERKGFANATRTDWFSLMWKDNFMADRDACRIAYVLTWTSPDWACFKEGPNAHLYEDFMTFVGDERTILLDGLSGRNMPWGASNSRCGQAGTGGVRTWQRPRK